MRSRITLGAVIIYIGWFRNCNKIDLKINQKNFIDSKNQSFLAKNIIIIFYIINVTNVIINWKTNKKIHRMIKSIYTECF